ncbi:hypothetical protein TSUD_223310 [Trifolium subterraneum]|uniref:Uncharacterized protein n=1 Tax=Trifolium subterraneum TaxID=3900 RepID=A0A2Z6MWL5_TRISU|nr:hypothetical protein TSUD_223310 [Trifolium subterraneum]
MNFAAVKVIDRHDAGDRRRKVVSGWRTKENSTVRDMQNKCRRRELQSLDFFCGSSKRDRQARRRWPAKKSGWWLEN